MLTLFKRNSFFDTYQNIIVQTEQKIAPSSLVTYTEVLISRHRVFIANQGVATHGCLF